MTCENCADLLKRAEAAEKERDSVKEYAAALEVDKARVEDERDEARKALADETAARQLADRHRVKAEDALAEARGKWGHVAGCLCHGEGGCGPLEEGPDCNGHSDPRCAPEGGGE